MVLGPRRTRSNYSLNIRCHGKTVREVMLSRKLRVLIPALLLLGAQQAQQHHRILIAVAALLLEKYNRINGVINAVNPRFVRTNLRTVDFEDHELYQMRITDRTHIRKLLQYHI
jgi:hypothetical protein